uniref:Activator of Hsp90 ATPase AHSA1-like N-terminal domain-containing protein n=1 Tax=Oryzias latipes TaxID=8090 RepID=A0A3P9HNU1_ORYLA
MTLWIPSICETYFERPHRKCRVHLSTALSQEIPPPPHCAVGRQTVIATLSLHLQSKRITHLRAFMAKWGEGDPRWIVEERADATNVNNWHWTERDVSAWSSDRLRQLLLSIRVEGPEGVCLMTEVSKLDGEASINNRKGKLFFFYEWQLKASWLGTSVGGVKYRGTVEVSNLSDENDEDDLDINVSLCKDQPNTPLLDLMKRTGVKEVRRVLTKYVQDLKSEFSQGMILPTADGKDPSVPAKAKRNLVKTRTQITPSQKSLSSPTQTFTGVLIPTCGFNLQESFRTSAEELYETFINQEFVQVFTRLPAAVDSRKGGKFWHLDGSVHGEFTELVPHQRIHMKWRFRTWPSEHFAAVSLELEDHGDETELRMECRGVPAGQEGSTEEGWKRFYFNAIKQAFGY